MEAENEKGEDGQRVQQLLQVIAELKLGGGPWGPSLGTPFGPSPTKDVREEEGPPAQGGPQGASPRVPQGGPCLRGLALDPAVQLEIKTLRMRLAEAEGALERAKEAQAAQQFSGQSVTGQRLITKCKTLQQENSELGKALAEGSLQPATAQLGALKRHVLFLKNELRQLRELNADLDNDNEDLSQQLQAVFVNFSEVKTERDSLKAQVAELEAKLKAATISRPSRTERSYAGRGSPSHNRAESSRREDPRGTRGPSADWSKAGGALGAPREEKSGRHSRRVWDRERSPEGLSRRGAPEGPPSASHSRAERGDRDRGERDRDRDRGRDRERDRDRDRERDWRGKEAHRRPSDDSRTRRGPSGSDSSRQRSSAR